MISTSTSAYDVSMDHSGLATGHRIEVLSEDSVTAAILKQASDLFGQHYGVWGPHAGPPAVPGARIRLGPRALDKTGVFCPGCEGAYSLARVLLRDKSIAHAFACRWELKAGVHQQKASGIVWITQLVVQEDFRGQGLATSLLKALQNANDEVFGIASSHPAAIAAAARAFSVGLDKHEDHPQLGHDANLAEVALRTSPVSYLKGRQPTSSQTFDTSFKVDHAGLDEVKRRYDQAHDRTCSLPDLPIGHEYLLVARVRHSPHVGRSSPSQGHAASDRLRLST